MIYMDHHATTPMDPAVLDAMLPYFTDHFGNAASVDHQFGHSAQTAVETARELIAKSIGSDSPQEIIFTSGATESDNIAILGTAEAYKSRGNHIITTAIEHKAVLECAQILSSQGFDVSIVSPDSEGMINPDDITELIREDTILISVMFANNEIGTIQPIEKIGEIAHQHEVFFHTDAAQAVGHLNVDVNKMNIDMMSFTAHKIYGPKGIGALYVRRNNPRVKPYGVIHGGGHERGMRSGTLNTPGIVGLAKALEIMERNRDSESTRLGKLTQLMFGEFKKNIHGIELNGHPSKKLPHNLNVFVPGVESKSILMELLDTVAISAGSACTTAKIEPSHVIQALMLGDERPYSSVRFGLGRFTTSEQISRTCGHFIGAVNRIKSTFGE